MDLRTERTKRSIINAFIELRATKPIEKITVKELAEHAYINKATFYSHYKDIYDLSEQLEEEAILSVLKSLSDPKKLISSPRQGAMELAFALYSQTNLFHTLFSDSRASLFADKLEKGLKQLINAEYPEYQNDLKWDICLSVSIQGGLRAFLTHSDKDMNEVVQIIGDINECLIRNYFQK